MSRSLNRLIDLYEYLTRQVKQVTKEVGRLARTEKYERRVTLLKTIPGVGMLSAMEILTELQDVSKLDPDQERSFLK